MSAEKKKKGGSGYSRFFSLTTYATEKQIHKVIGTHVKSVRAMCYIFHDKDEAEPHHHILMRTHSAWTPKQIANWFADLKDKDKQPINTFCETAHDMEALKKYILHADPESIEEGKYQYPKEAIKDFGMSDLAEKTNAYDNTYEIINRLLMGANPRELVRYYGRDFLYHYNCYYEVVEKIRDYEGYKEARMFSRMDLFNDANLKDIENMEDVE